VARYGQSKLSRFWHFARVELRPPMPSEFGQVQQGVQQIVKSASTGAWRHLTVKVYYFPIHPS
jgi:F-type H+-transporting ATPase subunit g